MDKSLKEYAQLIGKCLARRWMRNRSTGADQHNVSTALERSAPDKKLGSQETTKRSNQRESTASPIPNR